MHGLVQSPVSDQRPSLLSCTHGIAPGTPVQNRRKGRRRTGYSCLLLSLILTMLFAGSALADSFQFVDSQTNTSLGFWTVHVAGRSIGSTDATGPTLAPVPIGRTTMPAGEETGNRVRRCDRRSVRLEQPVFWTPPCLTKWPPVVEKRVVRCNFRRRRFVGQRLLVTLAASRKPSGDAATHLGCTKNCSMIPGRRMPCSARGLAMMGMLAGGYWALCFVGMLMLERGNDE